MKKIVIILSIFLFTLMACSNKDGTETEHGDHDQNNAEMKSIAVDFELPEEASVGDSVELKATVTSDKERIKDAELMDFEYWNVKKEEDKTTIEATNNEDGTYTAEVVFDEPGTYEIFAHTTANGIHTMPKKSITINE